MNNGNGFILPDDGGKDVFVHVTEVQKAGFTALVDGVALTFEIIFSNGKPVAGNFQLPRRARLSTWSAKSNGANESG